MSTATAGGQRQGAAARTPALTVEHLSVTYPAAASESPGRWWGRRGPRWAQGLGEAVHAVRDVSFTLRRGQVLGVVGESGSGKTTLALAAVNLLPRGAHATGAVRLGHNGRPELGDLPELNLLDLGERELAVVRGRAVGTVFQNPAAALNPVRTVGDQLAEAVRANLPVSRRQARARAVELLTQVEVPAPAAAARSYPHELSGGLRQRVLIAMALAGEPHVLVCDEPTAALDVTVQAQVLDTLAAVRARTGAAMLLVTHDLGVVAGHADRVLVMYAGRVVEAATVDELFERACMPYTLGLLGAAPRLDGPQPRRLVTIPGAATAAPPPGPGCAFAPRCPLVADRCLTEEPALRLIGRHRHLVACHHAERLRGDTPALAAALAARSAAPGTAAGVLPHPTLPFRGATPEQNGQQP